MKKLIAFCLVAVLVGLGSGLTVMQESFHSTGETYFYEKDKAKCVGTEVLEVYNEGGTTTVDKAVFADAMCKGAAMSITEKVSLVPPTQCDPYLFEGVTWGKNSTVVYNGVVNFENTSHQTTFWNVGKGSYATEVQGDSAITFLANKQFAPAGKPLLPIPKLDAPEWPTTPPYPIDP